MTRKNAILTATVALSVLAFASPSSVEGGSRVTFAPAAIYPMPISVPVHAVTAADFDADDDFDIAVAVGGHPGSIITLLNHGDGTFAAPVVWTAGSSCFDVATVDLNGDGFIDLAVANDDPDLEKVSVLLNRGVDARRGWLGFAPPQDYSTGSGREDARGIALGDLGDDLDAGTTHPVHESVTVVTNNGHGTLTTQGILTVAADPISIVTDDFSGDGDGDLGAAEGGSGFDIGDGGLGIVLDNGHGTLALDQTLSVGGAPLKLVTAVNPQGQPLPLDLDGDGDTDIVTVSNPPSVVAVVLNTTEALDPADLNEDGKVDGLDLAILLGFWGPVTTFPEADLNSDGLINGLDLAVVLGAWG
jgi:hypothetical protein